MIRGMHYMCWFRNDWNYHPSIPMKRLQQVQDVVDMNGNMLLWSCLESAAIGIQYLDKEANEPNSATMSRDGQTQGVLAKHFCLELGVLSF